MPYEADLEPATVVLLGAGASADAGLPTTQDLHEELRGRLEPLYQNLAALVFANQHVDVERLFRVIEFIHTVETRERPSDRQVLHESHDIARLVSAWTPNVQEYIDSQGSAVSGTPTGELIDHLYDQLWQLLWLGPDDSRDLRYLRKLLHAARGGTIVTLNYDNALEAAALVGHPIPIDADPRPKDRSLPVPGGANWVRIVKLHGSLNWIADRSSGSVAALRTSDLLATRLAAQWSGGRPSRPGIIFGAGNKLRAAGPYLDLYIEFRTALCDAQRLIIIGYGFRDEHVNELLKQWIEEPTRLPKLVRVSDHTNARAWVDLERWRHAHTNVRLEVIRGGAATTMDDLLKPTPALLRAPPLPGI